MGGDEGALTEADRFWSPAAISSAISGWASHQHETRATGIPHHWAHPPVVTEHHTVVVHIWSPTVHWNTKEMSISHQAGQKGSLHSVLKWWDHDCGGNPNPTFTESFVTEPAAAWAPTAISPQLLVLRPTAPHTEGCRAWPVCVIDGCFRSPLCHTYNWTLNHLPDMKIKST